MNEKAKKAFVLITSELGALSDEDQSQLCAAIEGWREGRAYYRGQPQEERTIAKRRRRAGEEVKAGA